MTERERGPAKTTLALSGTCCSLRLFVGSDDLEVVVTVNSRPNPQEQLRVIHRALQLAGIEVSREMARLRDAERKSTPVE